MDLEREEILPSSRDEWLKLRTKDITSTEVSVLFGANPYLTPFELWHRKKRGDVVEIEENERMKWGTRLERQIAAGVAEERDWKINKIETYQRIPSLRLGSTYDYMVDNNGSSAILEVKNVDSLIYHKNWREEDDTIEAPPHIELQLQHQMLVSGMAEGYIAALVGGNKLVLVERKADKDIHAGIKAAVAKFWETIEAGNAPEPDFQRDAEFIRQLYNFAQPLKTVESNESIDNLAVAHREVKDQLKDLAKSEKEIKAKLLVLIGDAEKCVGKGFTISAGMQGPVDVAAHTRKPFRRFSIRFKKEKSND